jgi:DNA topoisomerase-1
VIDYELTRKMENFLDLVVENKESWQRFCKGVHNKMGFSIPPVRAGGGGPSEGQLKYAGDLAQKNSLVIPEETLANGRALSLWIQAVVGRNDLTAKQVVAVPAVKTGSRKKPKPSGSV